MKIYVWVDNGLSSDDENIMFMKIKFKYLLVFLHSFLEIYNYCSIFDPFDFDFVLFFYYKLNWNK